MRFIKQLLIAWLFVAFLMIQGFAKDVIKPRPTLKPGVPLSLRKPPPPLPWSNFIYNSPEEKTFWDKLNDWSAYPLDLRRNSQGEVIDKNSTEGFTGYVKTRTSDKRTIYQYLDGYSVRHKSWYQNGQKRSEGNHKNGKVNGLSTLWHNGKKVLEDNWKDGKRDGLETSWFENGQKRSEINWKNGKMDGLFIDYNEDGKETMRSSWKDGKNLRE